MEIQKPFMALNTYSMNNNIKKFFHLYFYNKMFKVVYSELQDGTYVKTFLKDNDVIIDIISPSEYAAALTYNNYLLMKNIPMNPNV
jgi:hypothetical protein